MKFSKVAVVGACAVVPAEALFPGFENLESMLGGKDGMKQLMGMMNHPLAKQLLGDIDFGALMPLMPLMSSPEVQRIMSGEMNPADIMTLLDNPAVKKLLGGFDIKEQLSEAYGGADVSVLWTDNELKQAIEDLDVNTVIRHPEVRIAADHVLSDAGVDVDDILRIVENPATQELVKHIIFHHKLRNRVMKIMEEPTKREKFIKMLQEPVDLQKWIEEIVGSGPNVAKSLELPSDSSQSDGEGYFAEGTDFSELAGQAEDLVANRSEL